jgi:hypothetical protein
MRFILGIMSYKGITFHKKDKKWRAEIYHKGTRYNCGSYETETEAIRARDLRILNENLDVPTHKLKKPV